MKHKKNVSMYEWGGGGYGGGWFGWFGGGLVVALVVAVVVQDGGLHALAPHAPHASSAALDDGGLDALAPRARMVGLMPWRRTLNTPASSDAARASRHSRSGASSRRSRVRATLPPPTPLLPRPLRDHTFRPHPFKPCPLTLILCPFRLSEWPP